MSFKPFFVHRHSGPGKLPNRNPRGFTLYVSPDPLHERNIIVRTAWCSPKDQYCKKTGRSQAMASAYTTILNRRELPMHVASNEFFCGLSSFIDVNAWQYIYKYVL